MELTWIVVHSWSSPQRLWLGVLRQLVWFSLFALKEEVLRYHEVKTQIDCKKSIGLRVVCLGTFVCPYPPRSITDVKRLDLINLYIPILLLHQPLPHSYIGLAIVGAADGDEHLVTRADLSHSRDNHKTHLDRDIQFGDNALDLLLEAGGIDTAFLYALLVGEYHKLIAVLVTPCELLLHFWPENSPVMDVFGMHIAGLRSD